MIATRYQNKKKAGSISFLKKRNKKLLVFGLTRPERSGLTEVSKSFLVLFSKKALLAWRHKKSAGDVDFGKPGSSF